MTDHALAPVPTEVAYEQLRAQIASGKLAANQRLVEADLVAELGVSRGTIRSVLARLEHEGLTTREYNHGARVRLVSADEAIEILQVRSALEALGARYAATHATESDIADLRAIRVAMVARIDDGDLLGYSDQNSRLHRLVIVTSRHSVIRRLIDGLNAQMVRFQYRTILVPGRPQRSLAEHTAVIEAIAAHDADAAEQAMRRHLSHVACTLREIVKDPKQQTSVIEMARRGG
jgi:DNA-binding GntR family transcriptional regulator